MCREDTDLIVDDIYRRLSCMSSERCRKKRGLWTQHRLSLKVKRVGLISIIYFHMTIS